MNIESKQKRSGDFYMKNMQGNTETRALLFEELEMFADFGPAGHFRDFNDVSEALMAGYAKLMRQGMPCEMVGFAMLGATINLYDMFGMRASLPELLREAADRIESKTSSGHH
ncbi:hypothetical protein G6N82_02685 [Altererythrobacter sp. BO-6]|uniref:hypothetical protein n=1 Tax=Altererythrobacter sp. BO-6 TaxID=2604537 RepID=UPI0013E125D1|nr:hypothetical protein [Altererythrobacter sp. BO-6]QIG53204.1 hypothetical protein G6N82_02685 [Altererythrobacter sp. BO-6]